MEENYEHIAETAVEVKTREIEKINSLNIEQNVTKSMADIQYEKPSESDQLTFQEDVEPIKQLESTIVELPIIKDQNKQKIVKK